jgi:CHASE2 domain-containing sensor protein
LLHFDPDTKKLPLKWPVTKDSNPSTAQPAYDFEDTLALKVAQAYDPQLMTKYPKIKEFTDRKNAPSGDATHPYISFLQPEQFLSYTAGELLCGKNYAIATKEGAAKYCDPFPAALKNLRGKIVVVGGREEKDKHLSPIGEVDGFVLHANYIEALLDQRYFTPVHSLVNLFFGILVFIAILSSLRVPDPVKRVVMLMMTLAISYLSIFFLVMFLGFYLNPTFVSGSWLVIIIAHHVYENVLHRS